MSSLKELLARIEARERLLDKIAGNDDFDERADHEYDKLRDRLDEEEINDEEGSDDE